MAAPRIYLTGHVVIEHGPHRVDEHQLPGRQGRLAFVYLACSRTRPISRGDLSCAIWGDHPPPEVESAINAILSKLRNTLTAVGLEPPDTAIETRSGSLTLRLPGDTWIDLEAAANATDETEGAMRRGDPRAAWGLANIVVTIGRRPFLTDLEAPWIETRRAALRSMLVRALACLAEISRVNQEPTLAIQYTSEILVLEPFRETAYQELMRLHATSGNRAEALRVFGHCRQFLREELGTSPSPQTEAVFLEILRAEGS